MLFINDRAVRLYLRAFAPDHHAILPHMIIGRTLLVNMVVDSFEDVTHELFIMGKLVLRDKKFSSVSLKFSRGQSEGSSNL